MNANIDDDEISPPGYKLYRKDRDSRGGGVAILFKESLHVTRLPDIPGVEFVLLKVFLGELNMIIGGFYRPPSADQKFFEAISNFLCSCRGDSSNLILAGDFNMPSIDWNKKFPESLSATAEPLLDIVLYHDLTQLVLYPTRRQGGSSSVLDLFFVISGFLRRNPTIDIFEGISDHDIVSLTVCLNNVKTMRNDAQAIPIFSRADDVSIIDQLDLAFSDFVSLCESPTSTVDNMWCYFKILVHQCIARFVPTKVKLVKPSNPWKTKEIVKLERKTKKIRKQLRVKPLASTRHKLSALRLQLKGKIKSAKKYFFSTTMKNFLLSSPAKFWRHLSPKKKHSYNLQNNGETITDRQLTANLFNQFFSSVFTHDDGVTPPTEEFVSLPPIGNVSISESGVLSLLLNLDTKKSPGIDCIPNAFLVRYAEWCSMYLCIIFKASLSRAELPHDWKFGKITPIPKGGNPSTVSSFRPISLLCACAKIFEHIIFKHLVTFLDSHSVLDSHQHGFCRGRSTVTQLLETIHDFASALDRQSQVDIIFIDFEKAFDRVSHSKLLLKLRPILKNDTLTAWIESYLNLRYQCVSIGNTSSTPSLVNSGIPQGSVLGPLLFLIFVNDIFSNVPVQIKMFADDCILYHEIHSKADQSLLNKALTKIDEWCSTWQMTINVRKTVCMSLTRKRNPFQSSYFIKGECISHVNSFKYLGVTISADLRWNEHVLNIKNKAIRKLGYLRRSLRTCPPDIKLLAYKTFLRPLLEYASIVWDPYTDQNISMLEGVQRKSIRFVYNAYGCHISPTALLNLAELETLQLRRYHDRLKHLHLLYHENLCLATNTHLTRVDKRSTRAFHNKKLAEIYCRTNVFQNSFFPRTIREWNRLPANLIDCPTTTSFMRMLKETSESANA